MEEPENDAPNFMETGEQMIEPDGEGSLHFDQPHKQITVKDSEVERLLVGMVLDLESIKALIIKYQSGSQGFYMYEDWLRLHEVLFECKNEAIVEMWRVLKLINFGDDYVPTGLVFDTLVTLFNNEVPSDESEKILRRIFFRFMQINGKWLNQTQRDQIAYLRHLRRIIECYKEMITGKLNEGEVRSPKSNGKYRYELLHQLHNLYTYKKNLKKLQKIDNELKSCSFEPELHDSRKNVESRYLTSTRKTYEMPVFQEETLFETKVFRATPIPDYPDMYPKGYTPHVMRMKDHSENQHQKSILRPIVIGKAEQFSIGRRNKERQERQLKNKPILFLIEVEIGKRKFQIKVRQGQSEQDIVKQIQMLAGFSDPEIPQVVEQYFQNYFRRSHQHLTI